MKNTRSHSNFFPFYSRGRLILGASVCLVTHLLTIYLSPNTALNHVMEVSSSSWLQEHTADVAHSVCAMIPPLSAFLLPRVNPMALLSVVAYALIFLMDVVIEIK